MAADSAKDSVGKDLNKGANFDEAAVAGVVS